MAVTVVSQPEPVAPPIAPTRESAAKAALDKLGGQPKPEETSAAKLEPSSTATNVEKKTDATQPKTEAETLKAAIELERAVRDAQQARNEAQSHRRELELARTNEAARKSDWRRALTDAGHSPEDVIMDYVGGDGTAEKTKPTQQPTAQVDPEVAALRRELNELKQGLSQGAQQYTRSQRLESVRNLARGAGDEFSGLTALEAEDRFLSQLEGIEAAEGRQLGDVEVRAKLADFESVTRTAIKAQLKQLGSTPWAKEVMRELLAEIKEDITPTTTTPSAGSGSRTDLMNADSAPASRVMPARSFQEAKAAARAKALAAIEARRSGTR